MKQKQIIQLSLFVIVFFMFLLAGWYFFAKRKEAVWVTVDRNYDYIMKNDPIGQNASAKFHYYTLVLSWSPAFCDVQRRRYGDKLPDSLELQCGNTQNFGWVIHGLWPQNQQARRVSDHPRFCQGDLPRVDQELIEEFLPDSPSAYLLQGEWEKHGACAFPDARSYFEKGRELFKSLILPDYELDTRNELFRWIRNNNPQLEHAFLGANRNELFICYGLDWRVIDCPRSRIGY
ncbi:ribonuclease T [Actinobacillus seminis]|uniref:Ribonuclease T n=1 Tax=Actinobacillus seminis TaxID=722 RepID=A0A263HDK7_9PAST|nr:ribonuclease T [Actinobacillus seminis]OZN25520.1 ribonuclease T [Actinobacillus seminis]SUU37876.1 ribonuclease T2 [Actinobacillus seminis]